MTAKTSTDPEQLPQERESEATPPISTNTPQTTPLPRRDFLQLGLLGAAATVGNTLPAVARTEAAEPTARPPQQAESRRRRRRNPPAPTIDNVPVVDPAKAEETWIEPWVWRPSDWPGQQLHLNVVENENPGPAVGFGNPSAVLFSYGGITPGPTIRMTGDEILFVKLRNLLGEDLGKSPVGPSPDTAKGALTPELNAKIAAAGGDPYKVIPADLREDFCLGEHTNGIHSAHVTNLHTHGLHVRPDRNPDGTQSDNVIFRVMPQRDLLRRERRATTGACRFLRDPKQTTFLRDDEQAGEADYEFRIGDVQGEPGQKHPPGTFWYHPHSHGSTHNQVSSGMAGFLIVEGDVDEAINRALTGWPDPDPELKCGDYDYRERLMLIQRVLVTAKDPDAPTEELRSPTSAAVNGNTQPKTITMRPGAIERWRVLNGSVDGRGYRRFMVLEGQFEVGPNNQLFKYDPASEEWIPQTLAEVEEAKQRLYQLAMDGITLIDVGHGYDNARFTIEDLATQNAGTKNPLAEPPGPDCPRSWLDNPNGVELCRVQNVYKNGESLKNTYVRPNEVYMGPANRTDVFFQAPPKADQVYTVLAHKVIVHADNPQQGLQQNLADGTDTLPPGPKQIIVGYVAVSGESAPAFDVLSLREKLPPVPPYLLPVRDDELRTEGGFRTRVVTYSGWGNADFPLITVPDSFTARHPELKDLIYTESGPEKVNVLLAPRIRTMAIDGRKFDPTDEERPRMWLDSAEEWVLYNSSTMLWGDTNKERQPSYQYQKHYVSEPISRAEGQERHRRDPHFQVVTKGVDHPFHIHQNPFWVTRIEIPDENGELHNILERPRWMDTIPIPRHRGRVVFRSRFPDYVGTFVNHCHLLLHEDNGMMQVVEITPFEDEANCETRRRVASERMSPEEVSRIYARPSLREAYRQSLSFVDPNEETGQTFPGFEV